MQAQQPEARAVLQCETCVAMLGHFAVDGALPVVAMCAPGMSGLMAQPQGP
jgi:hypothetical protein